jgi:hypothetical protein
MLKKRVTGFELIDVAHTDENIAATILKLWITLVLEKKYLQ